MKTMYSLNELAERLRYQQSVKVDYLAPSDRIWMISDPAGNSEIDLFASGDGTVADGLRVNDVAHGQIAARLKIPSRYYDRLRHELPGLLDENVNRLLRHHPDAPAPKWMVRTLDGVARACLSDGYRRIDNWDIAEAILPILADIPDRQFPSTALTDTYMYIKCVSPRLTGQVKVGQTVRAGVYVRNSEVGWGKFVIAPFVETLECMNGMIISRRGEGMMEQVHLGRRVESDALGRILSDEARIADDRAFMLATRDVVRAAVDEARFHELVADMARAATEEPVQDVYAAVTVLAQKENLTDGESRSVLTHLAEGGDLSRWGMLSAVTRTAEDVDSYDRAIELETLGGKLLDYASRDWRAVAEATG